MIENDPATEQFRDESGEKQAGFRSPRSIRFLDSEWKCIEQAVKARGMNAAEPVRHASVSFATDRFITSSQAFPSEIMARIERIYRGVYLLSTLKRDEILRDGRQEELEKIAGDARESLISIRNEAPRPPVNGPSIRCGNAAGVEMARYIPPGENALHVWEDRHIFVHRCHGLTTLGPAPASSGMIFGQERI